MTSARRLKAGPRPQAPPGGTRPAASGYQLLLDSVQRTGRTVAPAITLPKTTFAYTQLANRLDRTGDGYAPFIKARLSTVADESGGQIDVNYSEPACDFAALPTPQTNTTRCFPQYIGGSTSDDPERQWFNKYVVTSVTATDRTGGAPDEVTTYRYLGGAAWHYDDDDGLTKEKFKTWSQWRGYGKVRVRTGGQGGAPDTAQVLRSRYQRMTAGSPAPAVAWLNWVIRLRDESCLTGTVQATISPGVRGAVAEIAWVVGTPWQGRGIATEAAQGLAGWLSRPSVHAIIAHVHPEHRASAAVAAAAGLTPTNEWHDGEIRWHRSVRP